MEKDNFHPESPLLRSLGVPGNFSDVKGPAVDDKKLRRFIDGTLGPNQAREVSSYVSSFREWYEALCKMLADEAHQ